MLIDEIKKANIKAMKEHDQNARTAYSMVISSYQSLLTSGSDKEVGDADLIKIIVKFGKELDEEGNGAYYVGDSEKSCISQGYAVNAWIPLPKPYRKE